jgi:hypothetical protein
MANPVVLPDGNSYDLSDYNQRVQARQNNPAYTIDDSSYLLRGSGGAPSSDPARGGNGNDGGTGTGRQVAPAIEGGAGTASPSGYSGAPMPAATQASLAQVVSAAANNLIPAGPGGANIGLVAQLTAQGTPLQQAVQSIMGGLQQVVGPRPATFLAPAATGPSGRGPGVPSTLGGPVIGAQSSNKGLLLLGAAALIGLSVLRRR